MKFDVPLDAEEGNYSIKFVVNSTAAAARATSKLTVTAPIITTTPQETDEMYADLSSRYADMISLLEEVTGKGATAGQLWNIEEELNATKKLLNDANAYIQLEQYASAAVLLGQAEDKLSTIGSTLGDIKSGITAKEIGFWTPVAVLVVIVIVVGVVIFIVTPPKYGYVHGRGYSHVPESDRDIPRGKSLGRRFKEYLEEKKRLREQYKYQR